MKSFNTLFIKDQESESKAFSKSMRNNKPGIFYSSVNCNRSYISLVFSPINLPSMKPVCSVLIKLFKTCSILLAIEPDAILYTVLNKVMGRQFFR